MRKPRYFEKNESNGDRAQQIWQILVGCAHRRETLTYETLARLLGHRQPKALAKPLGHILHFCDQCRLPALTVLVVNKNSGLPGEGLPLTEGERGRQREQVYRYNWFALRPPTPAEFADAYANA